VWTSSRVYLQHDAKDETLRAYGEKVMPAIAGCRESKDLT